VKDHVCLGAVMGAYGVRGEARVKSFCAEPSTIGDYGPLRDDGGRSHRLTVLRPVKGGYAVRLSGVASKEAADALRGQRLWAPRAALPEAGEDEFYHSDLVGLTAVDTGGVVLGRVRAVHDFGAGDLLELAGGPADGVLVPFTREVVPTVDVPAGRLVVDPPPGLLGEDGDAEEG
jgi:16S rRNA processing protein RimM